MNLEKEKFFDKYSSFYKTGQTGTKPKMLNARFDALIENNKRIIENATILDLANHDGRWSLAALKNGAKKVYGIEGKKDLVEKGLENMKKNIEYWRESKLWTKKIIKKHRVVWPLKSQIF